MAESKNTDPFQDVQSRRDTVLKRYQLLKEATKHRRTKLEDAKRFQQFRRDADELEDWIAEKMQIALDESYKDPSNLQGKIQKHQMFEAEISAHQNAFASLKQSGEGMVKENHFASQMIQVWS